MKIIIAGSRSITDPYHVMEALKASLWYTNITEVVCGMAPGVDTIGKQIAQDILHIPVKEFYAKWKKYGQSAGMIRNQQMGWYADGLLAVWDGHSSGTQHMIKFMQRLKKPVYIHTIKEHQPID